MDLRYWWISDLVDLKSWWIWILVDPGSGPNWVDSKKIRLKGVERWVPIIVNMISFLLPIIVMITTAILIIPKVTKMLIRMGDAQDKSGGSVSLTPQA